MWKKKIKLPWRDGRSVTEIMTAHRDLLVSQGILQPGRGYSEEELMAVEERLRRGVPDEVRELYRLARPRQVGKDHWPSMGLFLPDSDEDVAWYNLLEDRPHPMDIMFEEEQPTELKGVEGFMIGGTPFFDRAFILKSHPHYCDGYVLLTDHEWQLDCQFLIVASSFAEYLSRLCFFGGIELASFPGDVERFPSEHVHLLRRELQELNPEIDLSTAFR